jgi:hypothetical protein
VANVVETAREESMKEHEYDLELTPMPIFEDIFNGPHLKLKEREYDLDSTIVYTHSSGKARISRPLYIFLTYP